MASLSYPLEPGGPKRLEIAVGRGWKNSAVRLDGVEIGTISGLDEVKQGKEFMLPDGSLLRAQLGSALMGQELRLTRNGQPLPNSSSDPAQRVKTAAGIFYFVGGLTILLSLAALAGVSILQKLGLGPYAIVEGIIYLVLGYFVQRRSLIALIIGMILFLADTAGSFVVAVQMGINLPVGGLFTRLIFLFFMFQGFGAIRQLKAR